MSVVSAKFQVVIPLDVRRAVGIKPGMHVKFTRKGNIVMLEPEGRSGGTSTVENGLGMIKTGGLKVELSAMNGGEGRTK